MTPPPFNIRARTVGSTAARLLGVPPAGPAGAEEPATGAVPAGTVAATFERSCYLDLNGRIFALVLPDLLNGPINVVISWRKGFAFSDLRPGDEVHLDLRRATLWPAELRPLDAGGLAAARTRISVVETVLAAAPAESLAQPDEQPWRAAEAMSGFAEGLRTGDEAVLREAASRLAGLGPGLTPSGDDVLTGAMTALTLVRGDASSGLRRAIHEAASPRTTRVSAAYLEAASRGEAGEAWHHLRDALAGRARKTSPEEAEPEGARVAGMAVLSAEAEAARVETAARRVMDFGETSGADMLAGFVLAFRAAAAG